MTLLEAINTISSIISSFRDIIIIVILILGVRYIGKAIKQMVEHFPEYLDKWEKIKLKSQNIDKAQKGMKKI